MRVKFSQVLAVVQLLIFRKRKSIRLIEITKSGIVAGQENTMTFKDPISRNHCQIYLAKRKFRRL
ncbi:hypothetical protein DJ013_09345 [Arcticibacterium luteifluviistationis]|uniref:Uncharacterized protein n=1 Tax=Arcticibacterium luteifluviistationis TaxID=1784714 RepID=A0A2Z4GB49_9BACT|nr:hypothetical protein DJ013_09345 [Arcticibacterium luteifluviistationis]